MFLGQHQHLLVMNNQNRHYFPVLSMSQPLSLRPKLYQKRMAHIRLLHLNHHHMPNLRHRNRLPRPVACHLRHYLHLAIVYGIPL